MPPSLPEHRPRQQSGNTGHPGAIVPIVESIQLNGLPFEGPPAHPFRLGRRTIAPIVLPAKGPIELATASPSPVHCALALGGVAKPVGISTPELMAATGQKQPYSACAGSGALKPPAHPAESLGARQHSHSIRFHVGWVGTPSVGKLDIGMIPIRSVDCERDRESFAFACEAQGDLALHAEAKASPAKQRGLQHQRAAAFKGWPPARSP